MQAFITEERVPNGTEMFLTDLSAPSFVTKSVFYEVQTLIGDACIVDGKDGQVGVG